MASHHEIASASVSDGIKQAITDEESMFFLNAKNYVETPFTILGSYFQDHYLERLVRHQIESYNLFVNHQLNKQLTV